MITSNLDAASLKDELDYYKAAISYALSKNPVPKTNSLNSIELVNVGTFTLAPTPAPSPSPTTLPTVSPTALPSPIPTVAPSPFPTVIPSPAPSPLPTVMPTPVPSDGFYLTSSVTLTKSQRKQEVD